MLLMQSLDHIEPRIISGFVSCDDKTSFLCCKTYAIAEEKVVERFIRASLRTCNHRSSLYFGQRKQPLVILCGFMQNSTCCPVRRVSSNLTPSVGNVATLSSLLSGITPPYWLPTPSLRLNEQESRSLHVESGAPQKPSTETIAATLHFFE